MALCVTFDTVTGTAAACGAGAACSFAHPEAATRMKKDAAHNPSSDPDGKFDSELAITVGPPDRPIEGRYLNRFRNRELQAAWPDVI
jgi:hypothetical protein